jgi:tetratricopeptide (TPR) repeat protein
MTTRRRLLLAGVVPALLALLLLGKVVVMAVNDGSGREHFDEGDHPAAADAFTANQRFNLLQPWVAYFDEGAARHAGGDLDAAVDAYLEALETVPEEEECLVRVNLSLALEARADAARRKHELDAAVEDLQAGIDVLVEGGCRAEDRRGAEPDPPEGADRKDRREDREERQEQREEAAADVRVDGRSVAERAADARATARRLQEKLEAARQEAEDEEEREKDPKERELDDTNEQAEQNRQEVEEDVRLRDSEPQPTW